MVEFYLPKIDMVSYGLFRQNLNGTGTGTWNLTKTNGFLDIMLSFHTATYVGT